METICPPGYHHIDSVATHAPRGHIVFMITHISRPSCLCEIWALCGMDHLRPLILRSLLSLLRTLLFSGTFNIYIYILMSGFSSSTLLYVNALVRSGYQALFPLSYKIRRNYIIIYIYICIYIYIYIYIITFYVSTKMSKYIYQKQKICKLNSVSSKPSKTQ